MTRLTTARRSTFLCLTLAALATACSDAPTAAPRPAPAALAASRASIAPAAVGTPSLVLSPGAHDFGRVPVNVATDPRLVTVTNVGTGPATLGNVNATGDFVLTANYCPRSPSTLAPGASCSIWVKFWPSRVEAYDDTLTVRSDAPGNAPIVLLTGVGFIPTPDASVTPASLGFGSVQIGLATSGRVVKLTNVGDAPLAVSGASVGGANPFDFTATDECWGRTLSPGAWCRVLVSFEPTRVGTRTATLTIAHNGARGPSVVALSGYGYSRGGPIP